MEIKKPRPRREYDSYRETLSGRCSLCEENQNLLLKTFRHWRWEFAAFPYFKHHTLLLPARHIICFQELSSEELLELKDIITEVEARYRDTGAIEAYAKETDSLTMLWRSRNHPEIKREVEHFHLHVYPAFEGSMSAVLDPEAHDFDMNVLDMGHITSAGSNN